MFIERATLCSDENLGYNTPLPTPDLIHAEASQVGRALGAAMLPLKSEIYL